MATVIDGVTLANPVSVESNSVSVALHNVARGGIKRFVVSTNNYVKSAHAIKLHWVGLNDAEVAAVDAAWHRALSGYVTLSVDGLKIMGTATVKSVTVTVMPETAMTITYEQAFDHQGDGPLLYEVEAVFLTQPINFKAM